MPLRAVAGAALAVLALAAGTGLFPAAPSPASPADGGDPALAAEAEAFRGQRAALGPARPPRRPFRAIYVEGGPYEEYYQTLAGLVRGLHALGLSRDGSPPVRPDSADTAGLWSWLSRAQGEGGALEFPVDGFYTAGWSDEARGAIRRDVEERIRSRGDVDLILAFGTRAALDFACGGLGVPVMSLSVLDPEGAGLARPGGAPACPGAHVFVRRDRVLGQLRLFHGIFGFGRLGVPLEPTEEGRLSMAWPAVERAAGELGFETVTCFAEMEIPDREEAFRNLSDCVGRLAREADAVYLTAGNGMLLARMGELLAPLAEEGIPSFSQEGSDAVRAGVLMSAGQDDYGDIGMFEARALRDIAGGEDPASVPGVYRAHSSVSLNLSMAVRVGWNPPFEILVAADRIFQGMAEPPAPGRASWRPGGGGGAG